MAKSTDAPARCRAFLAALRRTANAELAFVQSGVNRSWAYWRRKRDPDFACDWAAAVATGRARLGLKAPARPRWDGVPLVLTGNFNSRERRLRRATGADFTDARKRVFLAVLRATCNVSAAARAANVQPGTARRHRVTSAPFREAWAAALDEVQMTLELALIEASIALFDPEPGEAETVMPLVQGMTAEVALQTLRLHKSSDRWRSGLRPADPETARAAILRQVDVVLRGDAARARRAAISR